MIIVMKNSNDINDNEKWWNDNINDVWPILIE